MPKTRNLFWQLYPLFVTITVLSILVITLYASREFKQFYLKQTAADLEARAIFFRESLIDWNFMADPAKIDALCKQAGKLTGTRLTVIQVDGRVIGDTEEIPARMDNHGNRPEVIQAFKGTVGLKTRKSSTLNQHMMYVALPIVRNEQILAVVRASLPITFIDERLNGIYLRVLFSGLVVSLIVAVISLFLSRRISRPLVELKKGAERFAQGDLESKIHVEASEEINSLGLAMNTMASQLHNRIQSVVRESQEKEAILSGMVEAVFTIDMDEKITSLNKAAAKLLGMSENQAQGRSVYEVLRSPALQGFIQRTLETEASTEDNIDLSGNINRFIQAHGTPLRDQGGKRTGALVVLHDVTNLHRLENIRREFVANVSHEIKTPLTSIRGSVETLLDGAADNPEDSRRFLEIIDRQSSRLESITEDLLNLSRIEQEDEQGSIFLADQYIRSAITSALQSCEVQAEAKKITYDLVCPEELAARFNMLLLEQAIQNLVDNAIKYSPDASTIRIEAHRSGQEVMIHVTDHGPGIPKSHLPRLFERFYRVDKARSRKMGGTGLGLAIVKHIMSAHHGQVSVESELGKGSTFTLHLPV